jgi:hypothetical protein
MRQEEWWRNVRDGAEVDLLLAGVQVQDSAVVLEGAQHSDKVSEGLAAYVRAMPRAGRALGLSPSKRAAAPQDADVRRIRRNIVLVRVSVDVS